METEPGRTRVGPLPRVDHGSDGVEHPTEDEEKNGRGGERAPEGGQEEDRHPAQRQVGGGHQPARCAEPGDADDQPRHRDAPDQAEDQPALPRVRQRRRERGVGAGDEQVDVGVVQLAQERVDAGPPRPEVVGRADPEQQDGGEHIDGHGGTHPLGRGDHQQGEAEHERQRRGSEVQPATQLRLERGDRVLQARLPLRVEALATDWVDEVSAELVVDSVRSMARIDYRVPGRVVVAGRGGRRPTDGSLIRTPGRRRSTRCSAVHPHSVRGAGRGGHPNS